MVVQNPGSKSATRTFSSVASIVLAAVILMLSGCGGSGSSSQQANNRPTASAGPDQTVTELTTVQLQGSGSDPDAGTTLRFSWQQTSGASVTLSSSSIARPTFTAPDVAAGETEQLVFELTVSDGLLEATDSVTITVQSAPNTAPTANAGPDKAVVARSTVQLEGSGSDPDPDTTLTYAWQQTSGVSVDLSDSGIAQPTFMAPDVAAGSTETLTFELTVSDGELSDTDSVTITVQEQPSSVTISGIVQYEFVPPQVPSPGSCTGLDYSATELRPIRRATVQLLDADTGNVIDTLVSSDSGAYSFTTDPNRSVKIRVRAELKRSGSPSWNVEVRDNTASTDLPLAQRPIYVLDTSAFDSGLSDMTRDVTAGTGWGGLGTGYSGVRAAAPFSVLDTIYKGIELVLSARPTAQFAELDAYWSVNNTNTRPSGVPFDEYVASGEIGTSFYVGSINSLFLLGAENADTEEFDFHVIAHEWGHYFEDNFSRSDSVGGAHGLGDRLDMRLAFGEGWATALSGMINDDSLYCDTYGFHQAAGFPIDIEANVFVNRGWYNERSVLSVVYDLWDSNSDGADNGSLGFGPIFNVMQNVQRSTAAFTSIFSFAEALKTESPSYAGLIDNLLSGQNINGTGIDKWGSTETNDSGGANDVFPIYTEITADGTTFNICSNSQYDDDRDGNKLSEYRYLRFALPSTGRYRFEMTNSNPPSEPPAGFDCSDPANRNDPNIHQHSDPDFGVFRNGVQYWGGYSCTANSEVNVSNILSAGEYIMDILEFRYADEESPVDYPSRSCFDIRITPQ